MSHHRTVYQKPVRRLASHAALTVVTLAALSACGGGGDSTPPASTLSGQPSVAVTRYGSPAVVAMSGTNLDSRGLSVTSAGCKNMTRLTAAPFVSTATSAYYSCTVSGALNSTVVVQSNGVTLANTPFAVPAPQVTFVVNNTQGVAGNIVLTLKAAVVPTTVDNFLAYVNTGFYDNTIFHRLAKLIPAPSPFFVMQGGGYGPTVNGALPTHKTATFPPIAVETAGGANVQWSIAMANSGDNTVTSEFFINARDNTVNLGNGYSVFGNITTGIDVAQAILAAPANCTTNGLANTIDCLPQPDVKIVTASQTQ